MTFREISNAYKGYSERITNQFKSDWEQTRWLAAIQANAFSSKKIQPRQLMEFPWEKEVDRSKEIEKIKEYRKSIRNG
jgi:hypothetical protein